MHKRTTSSRIHQVERLDVATVSAVAERVAVAVEFADLIYRESEIDALWSLADIAVTHAQHENNGEAARWLELRDGLGAAHDLVPDGRCIEAAEVLRATLRLL